MQSNLRSVSFKTKDRRLPGVTHHSKLGGALQEDLF